MIPNISQNKRRTVKKITVTPVEISKNRNQELSNRVNVKSYGKRSVEESKKEIAHQLLQEYLHDSSVHGVKYFGNLQICGNIGRLFWSLIMIFSLAFLSWMFRKVWLRYSTNPTRSIIESFQTPIFMAPFPAITICPLIPPMASRRKKVFESLRLPRDMSNATARFLIRYGPAFANENAPGGKVHVKNLRSLLKTNNMTLIEFVKALRPCEDLFEICMWDDVVQDCNQLFKISYTFAGICCSFNYVLEDYIESGRPVDYDKLRISSLFGPRSGITIVLNRDFLVEDVPEEEKYVKYSTNSVGLVMFPHHPLEYVATLATRIILQKNQELRVSITPFVKKKLTGYYEENSRGEIVPHCADEKIILQYFPSYRYSNCFTSCSINAFLQYCDCIPHYFTPIANKYSLRMCDWEDFECLYTNAKYTRIIQNTLTENYTCECITPCWDVEYELSTSYSELSGNHDFNVAHLYKNISNTQSILRVYMKSSTFMQMTTIPIADELYLLASLGGIFSLFLGCSFISAIEIIYFVGLYFRSSYKKSK